MSRTDTGRTLRRKKATMMGVREFEDQIPTGVRWQLTIQEGDDRFKR